MNTLLLAPHNYYQNIQQQIAHMGLDESNINVLPFFCYLMYLLC